MIHWQENTDCALPGRLDSYPAYKNSGIEWLGEIPAHWDVKRLKFIAPFRASKVKLDSIEEGMIYIGLENVESWTSRLLLQDQPKTVESLVCQFDAGDVLFGKLRPYLAKVARPDFSGMCSSEILALCPRTGCLQSHLMYCLLSKPYIWWSDTLTYGTKMPRVSPEQVGCSFVPFPPLPEQRAIAAFLDRETARIDALVAKKERLIELLHEKRTALISHVVAKGLDPDAPMKDSGIEWLGEIPAHWEVRRFKTLGSNFANGTTAEQLQYGVSDFPVSRIETISTGKIDYAKVGYLSEFGVIESFILKPDDFLISHINSYERVGNSARYKGNRTLIHGMNLIRVTPLNIITPGYLEFLLKSSLFTEGMKRACKPAINQVSVPTTAVKAIQFSLPPLPEQRAIAEFLDRETARIDALVTKVREVIDRHKELRTALISAAVTGKIDVHNLV